MSGININGLTLGVNKIITTGYTVFVVFGLNGTV